MRAQRMFKMKKSPMLMGLILVGTLFLSPYARCSQSTQLESLQQRLNGQKDKQLFRDAEHTAEEMMAVAIEAGDADAYVKAVFEIFDLKQGLYEFENAVEFLLQVSRPEKPESTVILNIITAEALVLYHNAYYWEISQREQVVSEDNLDLKLWTTTQIQSRINKLFEQCWNFRQNLGTVQVSLYPGYFDKGNYPADIRSTLRDFLTYQWANFLANSAFWTPRESAQLYKLPLKTMLSAGEDDTSSYPLTKSDLPLAKAAIIIRDLQQWHQSQNHRSNELESKLELVRILQRHYHGKKSDAQFENALNQYCMEYKDIPWSSSAKYELASLIFSDGRRLQAHQVAQEGAAKYPDSMGAKLCFQLIQRIEEPNYSLSLKPVDGLSEQSIQIVHRNMTRLYFRIYELSEDQLRQTTHARFNDAYKLYGEIAEHGEKPVASWTAELQDPKDFSDHHTYQTPPVKKNGMYMVAVSQFDDFRKDDNRIDAQLLSISEIMAVCKIGKDEVEIQVVHGKTGKPVLDAMVEILPVSRMNADAVSFIASTDPAGRVVFSPNPDKTDYAIIIRHKDSVLLDNCWIPGYPRDHLRRNDVIYTDRSIYRPGQTIMFKIIAFEGFRDDYQVLKATPVKMELVDPNGETIATQNLDTNEYGSASGQFEIDSGRLLGQYILRTPNGQTWIRVEEYKRPTFEVSLEDQTGSISLNTPVSIQGQAIYYFGMPLNEGDVMWTVKRRPRWPYWRRFFWNYIPNNQAFQMAQGAASLQKDGTFSFTFTPEADPDEADKSISYSFEITATVTGAGGETRAGSLTVNAGYCGVEVDFTNTRQWFNAKEPVNFTLIRKNLNGNPVSGQGTYSISELKQPEGVLMPWDFPVKPDDLPPHPIAGDHILPRWEKEPGLAVRMEHWVEQNPVSATGDLSHDADGKCRISSRFPPGAYRLNYKTMDAAGVSYTTHFNFMVLASDSTIQVPLLLQPASNTIQTGKTLTLAVGTGLKDQEVFLEFAQDGDVFRKVTIPQGSGIQIIKVPIPENLRGGFMVTALLVSDYTLFSESHIITVPWDNKHLDVSFSSIRNHLTPGDSETWTVHVNGPDAEPAVTELLAYMYDRSLEFFLPHNYPNLETYYSNKGRGRSIQIRNSVDGFVQVENTIRYQHRSNQARYHPATLNIMHGNPYGGPGRQRGGGRFMRSMAPAPQMLLDHDGVEGLKEEMEAAGSNKAAVKPEAASVPDMTANQPANTLRKNFQETAFFLPHLISNGDSDAAIEFTVPDSVTSWKVYVHAVTQDLKFGTAIKTVETKKNLMIRPYLPRYLRESDTLQIKTLVDNTGDEPLTGKVTMSITDLQTDKDCISLFKPSVTNATFSADPGQSSSVTFTIQAPRKIGNYSIGMTGHAGNFSDGEIHPLPVLPSRMHLTQSRFAVIKDSSQRTLLFEDLAQAEQDETLIQESLITTVDGQQLMQVLRGMPYLITYPYACVEQTANRFFAAGLLTSLYSNYPQMAQAAETFSSRTTPLEKWDEPDANRQMRLEETPWLMESRGGDTPYEFFNVLSPEIAWDQQITSLKLLQKAQKPSGAFPWWNGGPDSAYITLYVTYTMAKSAEMGAEIPRVLVPKALNYLYRSTKRANDTKIDLSRFSIEYIVFLNYVISCLPDESYLGNTFSSADRADMLETSFAEWKNISPYCKAMLALTLHRSSRQSDGLMILNSILDSARTEPDQGTFWAPEDRSWIWYNDTIESHSMILQAVQEINPDDPHLDGLALWLLLNKKTNHWKSTKATAEALYALTHYFQTTDALNANQSALIKAGSIQKDCQFSMEDLDHLSCRLTIPGKTIRSKQISQIEITTQGKGFTFASADWHFSTEKLPEHAEGDFLHVERSVFIRKQSENGYELIPVMENAKIKIGDQIEVHLSITAKHSMEYMHLRDPRGAGFEPESQTSGYHWDLGLGWYEEIRDSGVNFFFERIPQGEYTLKYRLRASLAGRFKTAPATLQSMYAPEFTAYSQGHIFEITSAE